MEQEVEKGREKRDVGVRHETEEAQEYNTNFEAEAQYEKEGVKESVREQEVLKVGGRNVKHERQHLKGCVGGGGGTSGSTRARRSARSRMRVTRKRSTRRRTRRSSRRRTSRRR